MRIRIKLFSIVSDLAGFKEATIEVNCSQCVLEEVIRIARQVLPGLDKAIKLLGERGVEVVYLVNGVKTPLSQILHDGDEVAIIPPASGG